MPYPEINKTTSPMLTQQLVINNMQTFQCTYFGKIKINVPVAITTE